MSKTFVVPPVRQRFASYEDELTALLSGDLDFHGEDSKYLSHNYHPFPAKFPPQLPRKFIHRLAVPGEIVLDPMAGSGTTIVEALIGGHKSVGVDIDPLAVKISQVKITPIDRHQVTATGERILRNAARAVEMEKPTLETQLTHQWDKKTKDFVDYWFASETQVELLALANEIRQVRDPEMRRFFELVFSATIITKSGGVSLAFDLAHTRPHRAKVVLDRDGKIILGESYAESKNARIHFLTKTLRSPLLEFHKRFRQNLEHIIEDVPPVLAPNILYGNAQSLPLDDDTVGLIVTSPPYASNAIDYMRAHKFSLVWFGYSVDELSRKRKTYIGGETIAGIHLEAMPPKTQLVISKVAALDEKKGRALHRYYSEMTRTLAEMYRVLKLGRAAIVVVGSSIMRGVDTQTAECLAEIGQVLGFRVSKIGVRNLDRNRRMLPAGTQIDKNSQIQQRMHQEFVIGFFKPEAK